MDWKVDQAKRAEPRMLTRLFHTAVPVLKFLDWHVVATERGAAETLLPLNVPSSNQHITHQAAVMMIAADYTGGIALGTLLDSVPLVGVHPQETDYGAYLWGAKADMKWIRPSTDDLHLVARIDQARHEKIVKRFFDGRRVLETVHIDMFNSEGPVAEANFTYWVQDTIALRRDAFDEKKIHLLYDHRKKTSAKLIAGLRALEQRRPVADRRFTDEHALSIAGKHGVTLADRFVGVAPQIQPMVAARTYDADELARRMSSEGPFQLVNVGAGLDLRSERLALPAGSTVFNLDLPKMLTRRRDELTALGILSTAVEVPIDLLEQDVLPALMTTGRFVEDAPTLVLWEGGSMYFDAESTGRILRSAASVLTNPRSRMWFDYVDQRLLDGSSIPSEAVDFLNAMKALGEPFIHGFSSLSVELAKTGLVVEYDTPSGRGTETPDPLFEMYRFCVAARAR